LLYGNPYTKKGRKTLLHKEYQKKNQGGNESRNNAPRTDFFQNKYLHGDEIQGEKKGGERNGPEGESKRGRNVRYEKQENARNGNEGVIQHPQKLVRHAEEFRVAAVHHGMAVETPHADKRRMLGLMVIDVPGYEKAA
jgi:hypothetical protein